MNEVPEDRGLWKQNIIISPIGLAAQTSVDLTILGSCDCENEDVSTFIHRLFEQLQKDVKDWGFVVRKIDFLKEELKIYNVNLLL